MRTLKVQQKVSGSFHSAAGAAAFSRLRGYLSTLNKQGVQLLAALAHPRWEFVFQPKYAAYLNLIEPWWKILRSLALAGRRLDTWDAVWQAVEAAAAYWNAHKHPFIWDRRRRHRPRRHPGVAAVPLVA